VRPQNSRVCLSALPNGDVSGFSSLLSMLLGGGLLAV
jgi:hypothetical protein